MDEGGIVYLVIDGTNDMEYVGQTTKTVEERFKQHMKADTCLGHAIRAHDAENFTTAILKVCCSKEELDFWEKHMIKFRDTKPPYGYNLTDGGEGNSGWHHKPETIAQMSESHTGKKLTPEHCANIKRSKLGEKHPFFGKHHTKEHCDNIAAGLRAHKRSPEHCANLRTGVHKRLSKV